MKVQAPFHVGLTFKDGWELFSFRAMKEFMPEVRWDYYFCQRLASQGERLLLQRDFETWLAHRKFVNRLARRRAISRDREATRKGGEHKD